MPVCGKRQGDGCKTKHSGMKTRTNPRRRSNLLRTSSSTK
jgi:hypothetical protein